jgi:hypothetical protein
VTTNLSSSFRKRKSDRSAQTRRSSRYQSNPVV